MNDTDVEGREENTKFDIIIGRVCCICESGGGRWRSGRGDKLNARAGEGGMTGGKRKSECVGLSEYYELL